MSHRYTLLTKIRAAVNNGFVRRPLWLEPMLMHPPPGYRLKAIPLYLTFALRYFYGPKPKAIQFPEDRLRHKILRRHPELQVLAMHQLFLANNAQDYPVRAVPGTSSWYKHPVDIMAFKQLEYMNKGLSEEEGTQSKHLLPSQQSLKLFISAFTRMESDMHDRQIASQIEAQLATQQAELLGITSTPIGTSVRLLLVFIDFQSSR